MHDCIYHKMNSDSSAVGSSLGGLLFLLYTLVVIDTLVVALIILLPLIFLYVFVADFLKKSYTFV
jgi:hypothetical protein